MKSWQGWKKGSELAKNEVTVQRSDILLEEYHEEAGTLYEPYARVSHYWTATLDGPLSTGEHVRISRTGEHAGEALLALRSAIEAEGWLIVD